jgi:hypothetical protein
LETGQLLLIGVGMPSPASLRWAQRILAACGCKSAALQHIRKYNEALQYNSPVFVNVQFSLMFNYVSCRTMPQVTVNVRLTSDDVVVSMNAVGRGSFRMFDHPPCSAAVIVKFTAIHP